jgi:hypothetical protein
MSNYNIDTGFSEVISNRKRKLRRLKDQGRIRTIK